MITPPACAAPGPIACGDPPPPKTRRRASRFGGREVVSKPGAPSKMTPSKPENQANLKDTHQDGEVEAERVRLPCLDFEDV